MTFCKIWPSPLIIKAFINIIVTKVGLLKNKYNIYNTSEVRDKLSSFRVSMGGKS